jgi:hypothetical protein
METVGVSPDDSKEACSSRPLSTEFHEDTARRAIDKLGCGSRSTIFAECGKGASFRE